MRVVRTVFVQLHIVVNILVAKVRAEERALLDQAPMRLDPSATHQIIPYKEYA